MPTGCSQPSADVNGYAAQAWWAGDRLSLEVMGQNVTAYNIMDAVVSQRVSIIHSPEGRQLENHGAGLH